MTIWIIMIALTICVAAIMVLPMYMHRNKSQIARQTYDIAVYKDQLEEINRDLERKIITQSEADNVRYEIQQRVLASENDNTGKTAAVSMKPGILILALVAIIPLSGVALYLKLGSPDTPDYPLAQRTDIQEAQSHDGSGNDAPDMNEMIASLRERLIQSPDDLKGWSMLARSLMVVERYSEAAETYKKLYELSGDIMDKSEYAEARLMANNSVFTPEVLSIFHEISKADPLEPRSRFYIGMEALQSGNAQAALQIWMDLLYLSPADAPWVPAVENQINLAANESGIATNTLKASQQVIDIAAQAGIGQAKSAPLAPGPSAEDVQNAQQMSPDEQNDMIRAMVQRLADRLAENPNDAEGWKRLATAYDVLGETDKAETARQMAEEYSK